MYTTVCKFVKKKTKCKINNVRKNTTKMGVGSPTYIALVLGLTETNKKKTLFTLQTRQCPVLTVTIKKITQ